MKQKDIEKIKKGEFIEHKYFGLCYVERNQLDGSGYLLGLVLRPVSMQGIVRLARASGVLFNRTLEGSKKLIISKVENTIIPKLIFKTTLEGEGFAVHEWDKDKIGEVSIKGEFSTIKLKEFKSLDDAKLFAFGGDPKEGGGK